MSDASHMISEHAIPTGPYLSISLKKKDIYVLDLFLARERNYDQREAVVRGQDFFIDRFLIRFSVILRIFTRLRMEDCCQQISSILLITYFF